MASVLIAGYYGFNNLGDEAILSAILASLRESSGYPVTPIVVSGNPALTTALHGVESISLNDISAVIAAAQNSLAVVIGGGGLFHDYFGFDPNTILTSQNSGIGYPVTIAALASALHKPLFLYAVGVGPLFTDTAQRYTRAIFQQAATITVRDADSRTELTRLGIPDSSIVVTADPAYLLHTASDARVAEIFAAEGLTPAASYVGVSLRAWDIDNKTDEWAVHVAHALDNLVEAHNVDLLYVPFQVEDYANLDDRQVATILHSIMRHPERLHILANRYTPTDIIGVLKRCCVVLGMRLHALILAAVAGTPIVGVSYDPKVTVALQQLGAEGIAVNQLSADVLTRLLTNAITSHDELVRQLTDRVATLASAAHETGRLFDTLLRTTQANPSGTPPEFSQALINVLRQYDQFVAQLNEQASQATQAAAEQEALTTEWQAARQQLQDQLTQQAAEHATERQLLLDQATQAAAEQEALTTEWQAARQQLQDQLTQQTDAYTAEQQRVAQFVRAQEMWHIERQQLITQVAYEQNKLKNFLSSRTWRTADAVRRALMNPPFKAAAKFVYKGTRKVYQTVLPYDTRTKLARLRSSVRKKGTNVVPLPLPTAAVAAVPVAVSAVAAAPVVQDKPALAPNHQDIFIFSIIEFEARFQRPQQLAVHLARNGYRVFYVSSAKFCPPTERPRYRVKEVAPGVFELMLPSSYTPKIYETILEPQLQMDFLTALADVQRDLAVYSASMIVHLPFWTPLAFSLKEKYGWFLQYDCMDEWEDFPLIHPTMLEQEKVLVRDSDLVSVTAQLLYDKWASQAKRCVLARNAVNFGLFEALVKPNNLLAGLEHPIIGYYGAIAEWLDLDLVVHLARNRPQWNIVMLGDTFVDVSALKALPNVHLLGRKPHEEMPQYLYHFDVCIIPFKINKVTDAVDPVKFYEYVSAGKPIVAARIIELLTYEDYLYLAATHDEFLAKVDTALLENDTALRLRRVELARSNDWMHRAVTIKDSLNTLYPKVSIIIVTFGNDEITRGCVESILRNTDYPNYEIILVDNASRDGTRVYLQYLSMTQNDRIKVILNADNRGFAAANNQGIKIATGDRILLLNNDTVVPRGWLWNLMRHLENREIGLVGPVTNQVGNEARITVEYTDLAEMDAFAQRYMKEHAGEETDIKMLAMYCVAARREVVDQIGLLDEEFGLGLFEDDDYSNRMKQAGYRVVCARDTFVHHYGQASFKKLIASGAYQAIWDKNQDYYEKKWGKWDPHKPRTSEA